MKTTTKTEPSQWLSFMGICPPEEFRCRIYSMPEPEPMTRDQARAWLLREAVKNGAKGVYAPRGGSWDALVDEMCDEGVIRLDAGLVYAC